jgi:NADP-reducing hydrogenase subunit HndB
MGAMTLEQLRALRAEKRKELSQRDAGKGAYEIIVGMGTCGIAAGAKQTFNAIIDELAKQEIATWWSSKRVAWGYARASHRWR